MLLATLDEDSRAEHERIGEFIEPATTWVRFSEYAPQRCILTAVGPRGMGFAGRDAGFDRHRQRPVSTSKPLGGQRERKSGFGVERAEADRPPGSERTGDHRSGYKPVIPVAPAQHRRSRRGLSASAHCGGDGTRPQWTGSDFFGRHRRGIERRVRRRCRGLAGAAGVTARR